MYSKYFFSAETKKYVKYSIYMHFFLSILVILQLVFHFGNKLLGYDFPEVPKPMIWEYIWLSSLIPGLAGYLSLKHNRISLMNFYYRGTLAVGLGPILTTMVLNASDLLEYAQTKQTSNLYHDFPVIVLWYMYLFVVIQIQCFGLYFGRVLIRSWSKDIKKRK
jgi:hypothetical protein